MAQPTRRRALCCECGELRTVSSNFRGGNFACAGLARWGEPRYIQQLKCRNCGRVTSHALILDDRDPADDDAEKLNWVGGRDQQTAYSHAQFWIRLRLGELADHSSLRGHEVRLKELFDRFPGWKIRAAEDDDACETVGYNEKTAWVIVDDDLPRRIAHALAHSLLRHGYNPRDEFSDLDEAEADALAGVWIPAPNRPS